MNERARFSWLLGLATALVAVVFLAGAAGLAVSHLHDLYGVRHLTGIWMALAQAFNAGTFYPPLEADGHYAGTRYMPALFVFIAELAGPDGDYLFAAKLSALISVALLLSAVVVAVRRITGGWREALALAGLVLAFPQGLSALLTPHADALAVACALAGLLLLDTERPSLPRALLASLFFVAALATKFSSLAGPAAAIAFLLVRDGRRPALAVAVPVALLSLAGLAALHFGTDGRFLANFRGVGSGGMSGDSLRLGPARLGLALALPSNFLLIWPVALVALLLFARGRHFGLLEWYWFFTLGTTLLIFTSPGTDPNHLLELQVASVLVVGRCLQVLAPPVGQAARLSGLRPGEGEGRSTVKRTGEPPVLRAEAPLWGLILAALLWGAYDLHARSREPALTAQELVEALPSGPLLLSEDASVPVLLGQRPVVMDAFAFRVLAERGLVADSDLAFRIDKRQFDVLVMMGRIDVEGESLCPRFHFGPLVTAALRRNYRFERQVGGYYVYVRRQAPALADLAGFSF